MWEGDDWVVEAVRQVMAIEQNKSEAELKEAEEEYGGKIKQAWIRRLEQMLHWKSHPKEMLAKIVYFRGKVKNKWLQGCNTWAEVQQKVLEIEGVKGRRYKELLMQGLQMLPGLMEEQEEEKPKAKRPKKTQDLTRGDGGPSPKRPRTQVLGVSNSNLT